MDLALVFREVAAALEHARARPRERVLEQYVRLLRDWREAPGPAPAEPPASVAAIARRVDAVSALQLRIFRNVEALERFAAPRAGGEVVCAALRARELAALPRPADAPAGPAPCALTGRLCEDWCVLVADGQRFRVERGAAVESLLRLYNYRHFLKRAAAHPAPPDDLLDEFLDHEAVVTAR